MSNVPAFQQPGKLGESQMTSAVTKCLSGGGKEAAFCSLTPCAHSNAQLGKVLWLHQL